jgi:hypothetical protein
VDPWSKPVKTVRVNAPPKILAAPSDRALESRSSVRPKALARDAGHATAAFNLGIALEDLRRPADAIDAYRRLTGET